MVIFGDTKHVIATLLRVPRLYVEQWNSTFKNRATYTQKNNLLNCDGAPQLRPLNSTYKRIVWSVCKLSYRQLLSGCSISSYPMPHLKIHPSGWHTMEHDCAERTDVETKDWIFLAIKAAFEQLRWWHSRSCWLYQYWQPEITMKIIKTILSESLEFDLKSIWLKVTDPYNVKPLSLTDPYTAIWPIRTTVVINIACFLWRLWNDYMRDCVNEHVLSEKKDQ